MKYLTQVALLASLALLLSVAGYAAGQIPQARSLSAFPPMVLPVAGPAVHGAPAASQAPAPTASSAPATEPREGINPLRDLFAKAREAYVKANLRSAAADIRRSAEVLRSQESKASPDLRRELAATAMELDRLALQIEQQKVKAASQLDTVFSRANHAVAEHHKEMAKTPAPAVRTEMTTPRPGIPSTAVGQAMPSGKQVSAAYAPTGKPAKGAELSYAELNKRIDTLSKEIASLREDLKWLQTREANETD